jgi:uncharacterized protein YjbJ (UPF0337 family)
MNTGKPEAVHTDRRKKTGSMPRKICDRARPRADPAARPQDWVPDCMVKRCKSLKQEKTMKPSTTDQIQGKLHELKGKTKEQAGKLTNNPRLTAEGQTEKLAGKIQKKIGQFEKVLEK